MSRQVYTILDTEVVAAVVGNTASAVKSHGTYCIVSPRIIHVVIGAVATISDFYIPANIPTYLSVGEGQTVNVILATGEVNGDVYISHVYAS